MVVSEKGMNKSSFEEASCYSFSSGKMNKRGQNLTLGTIILIVLGIAVLVFLIFGFSKGWNNLWDQINARVSSTNVEIIKTSCETDCSQGEPSSYCFEKKELRYFDSDGKSKEVVSNCEWFESPKEDGVNNDHVQSVAGMNFKGCPQISCASEAE